jgi:hypothetical protein
MGMQNFISLACTQTQGRIKVLGGPWQSVHEAPPKNDDEQKRRIIAIGNLTTQAKNLQKKLNVGAAGRFFRIGVPQAIFF